MYVKKSPHYYFSGTIIYLANKGDIERQQLRQNSRYMYYFDLKQITEAGNCKIRTH